MKRTAAALTVAALGAVAARAIALRPRRNAFRDRAVLISGGARGLGLQIARELAGRGARVALIARSSAELDVARAELSAAGTTVATAVCDVRDGASVTAAVARVTAELGPIDALFNVAGVIEVGPVDALSIDDYRDAIETNYLGAVRLVEAVRPSMQERGAGRITNIASLGGRIPVPHLLPYSASKFAMLGYSEGLHAELARYGIAVTTIVPGLMRTGSPPQATFAGQPKKEYAMFAPMDALPFTSISVEKAARQIVAASARRDAEAVISWQAHLAVAAYRIAPKLVVALLANGTRLLPDAGGSTQHLFGHESETAFTRSPITKLSREATHTQHEDVDRRATQTGTGGA